MDCLEFRRICGGDPNHPSRELEQHEQECSSCAAFARETREFDGLILRALKVEVPASIDPSARQRMARRVGKLLPGRWMGLAASVALSVGIGSAVWLSSSPESLAADVVAHIHHEPGALERTAESVDPQMLSKVMSKADARFEDSVGTVSYAKTCWFRGWFVPHLVIQGEVGPVTVLLLPDEPITAPEAVDEDGFHGRIVPFKEGSIAIVGYENEKIASLENRIIEAVEWSL